MLFTSSDKFQVPIPTIFHSFEHDAPFSKCVSCDRPLREKGVSYFIEKLYRKDEVVFEYALCESCRSASSEMISFESMTDIGSFLMDKMDSFSEREKLLANFDNSVQPWLKNCFFTDSERISCDNFQICAECDGPDLVVSLLPMMISEEATEIFQSLMSKQTRDSLEISLERH